MKTFLIVLAILILLGIVIFLLIRKPEKVIDDNSIVIPNSDSIAEPGSDSDIDESFIKTKSDIQDADNNGEACLQEGVDYSEEKESDENINEEEVHIPEHCRIPKCDEALPNKYFFNVHEYTSKKGRKMFCVVCSAVINNENYRIIVKNSYYPYLGSYTSTLMKKIESMFEDKRMSVEEFLKLGSVNFNNLGQFVITF